MSLGQNCTQSVTFQGFNAKADDPKQLTHQMCSWANFHRSCNHTFQKGVKEVVSLRCIFNVSTISAFACWEVIAPFCESLVSIGPPPLVLILFLIHWCSLIDRLPDVVQGLKRCCCFQKNSNSWSISSLNILSPNIFEPKLSHLMHLIHKLLIFVRFVWSWQKWQMLWLASVHWWKVIIDKWWKCDKLKNVTTGRWTCVWQSNRCLCNLRLRRRPGILRARRKHTWYQQY